MEVDTIRIVPTRDDAVVPRGLLAHLSDLDGFMVADPVPDIRGWHVVLPNGRRVGKVDDLIVDTDQLTVKYLEVKVDSDVLLSDRETWVLVPVQSVPIRIEEDRVVIEHLPVAGIDAAPRSDGNVPTPEQEREIREFYEIIIHSGPGSTSGEVF
jgi:sporulation protein YlmC with PRC-barrel domain